MANVMLKSLNVIKIFNGRLSFRSLKHFHGQCLIRSYVNTRQTKAYATAAYKLAANEDSSVKNNDSKSNLKDLDSIDDALSNIDFKIRRNGRTQLKKVHEILSAVTSKELTSSIHGLYLMRSCKYCYDEPPSKRIDLVNQIWNRYQELGIEFDVRHYNALLDVHVTNGLDFNPSEILDSMQNLNIEPNKTTYMLIMQKYCQDGNISGASEILQHMKEKNIPIDEKVFNYLIEGHIKNNDMEGAKEIVEVMRSSNLEPTADTYTIFACGYAAIGDKNEMMANLKECEEADNAPNCLKVISVLASSGNHQYIDDVLSLIQQKDKYRQDFINSAMELIHKNFTDVSFKLALATFTPEYNEGINIFVKELMQVGKEPSELVKYCEHFYDEGYERIFSFVLREAVEHGQLDYGVECLKKMEGNGYYLRASNFWPFLTSMGEKSPQGLWLVLKKMSEFGIPCDFTTYIDMLFPKLGLPHPNDVLRDVKEAGQSVELAADALFVYYCSLGKIDCADRLIEIFPVRIGDRFDVRNLVNLYSNMSTEDVPKYFRILKYIFMKGSRFTNSSDVQGRLLAELIIRKPRLLGSLLSKYENLKFTNDTMKVCEQELRERDPARLGELRKMRIWNSEKGNILKEHMSVEEENKYISHLQAQNIQCKPFLTKRIQHHIKEKNVVRINELLSLFDELKLDYPPLVLSNLVGIWCAASDIEKAKETVEKLKRDYPNFKLDLAKELDYVALLMKYRKFDESYEALKQCLTGPHSYTSKDSIVRSIRRFNRTLSDTQDVEYVKKMQNLMLSLSDEVVSKKVILEPSVDVHLQRNDLASAFEEFKNIAVTHRIPACLNNFLKRCINSNEKDILQKVIDLTTSVAGKSYALLELAVAFIETYNTKNALKVVEKLGQETDPTVLENICAKLVQVNKLAELEELIFITKSLSHVDRERLYCYAFKSCADRNDFERALKLFDKLKKEVVEPSAETLKLLQQLFEKSNQPLPLSLVSKGQSEVSPVAIEATKTLLGHIEAGNAEEALVELNALKKGYIRTLPIKVLTDIVDLCLKKDHTRDLSLNVNAMSYIIENAKDVLRPLLETYSKEGDIEKFNAISSFIPDFSLMSVNFNSYFCKAHIVSGKYEELLSRLEQHVDKKNKVFSFIAFEDLLKLPEFEDRIFSLAVNYFEHNYDVPMAVVWAHYFTKGNYEKAGEIFKNFTFNFEKVDNIILKNIKANENVDLAKKYVDFIKSTKVRSRVKERAYGGALDLLVFKGLYDEAVALVVESEKQNLVLHKFYLSTLITLKNILEKEGKPVPFTLPLDLAQGSSSDSE